MRYKGTIKDEGDFFPWWLVDTADTGEDGTMSSLAEGYHGTRELAERDMKRAMESRGLPLSELEIVEG